MDRKTGEIGMGKLVELTEENFDEIVTKTKKPVLVDFSASWCAPCVKLDPIIKEIAAEYDGRALICHCDVDNAQSASREYQVMSVPTCMFFKNGEPKDLSVGLVPKEVLTQKIDDLL